LGEIVESNKAQSKFLVACGHCQAQYDVTGRSPGQTFHCRCGGTVLIKKPRMHDARLVRCASCGSARNNGENCDFCGARFSAVDKGWGGMCPGCYCRLPNDAQYCVECGLRINPRPLHDIQTKLECPRCKVALSTHKLDQFDVTECGSCAGVWLGVETFDHICKSKETQSATTTGLKKARGRKNVFELSVDEQVQYVPCPKCRNLMNRRNFARVSGVIIDTCRDCGVWLDNQELSRIIQFINAGGLEKTRDIETRERAEAARAPKSKTPSLPLSSLRNDSPGLFSLGTSRRSRTSGDLLGRAIEGVVTGVLRAFLK